MLILSAAIVSSLQDPLRNICNHTTMAAYLSLCEFHPLSTLTITTTDHMVFHDNKKRRQRHANIAKPASAITIQDLPDELLLKILDNTPIRDLLKCRQTSRVLVPASTSLLRSRLKVLYVHPTAPSLRTAIELCRSDLCTEIEEVALLGKVPWPEILKYARDPRAETERARRERRTAISDYLPWTAEMPKSKLKGITSAISTDQRAVRSDRPGFSGRSFAKTYVQLLDALTNLPKARKLSFRSSCVSPAFNMISRSQIESHTLKSCQLGPQASRLGLGVQVSGKKKKDASEDRPFSDADAIFALLDSAPIPYTELVVTDEMRYVSEYFRSLSPGGSVFPDRLRHKVSKLTSVEFHVTTGWLFTEWQRTCYAILAQCAPQLQSLTLRFQHNAAMRTAQGDKSLSTVIRDLNFPQLQKLKLVALLPTPEDDRNWRPVCHMYSLAQFVENHRSSLTSIRLENVLFGMPCDGSTLLEQMRSILAMRRRLEAAEGGDHDPALLIDVTWVVNRYARDPRCNKEDTGAGHNCKHDCGFFAPISYGGATGPVGCRAMRELAVELGATTDNKVWAFRSS